MTKKKEQEGFQGDSRADKATTRKGLRHGSIAGQRPVREGAQLPRVRRSAETIPVALVEQPVWSALQAPFDQFADRVAIQDRNETLTFSDLKARIEGIAALIHTVDLGKKRAIGLLLTQGAPFVAALLATLKTGHYYVPLNPANPVESNRQFLHDAEARLLLADANHAAVATKTGEAICQVVDIDWSDQLSVNGLLANAPTCETPAAGDLAGLFYTSGTTGQPKGVMQTQRNFLHGTHCFIRAMKIGPDDRLLLGYHGSTCAAVKNIFAGLLTGATLCPWNIAQDGSVAMADWLIQQRISVFYIFRSAFSQCMSVLPSDVRFPHVRAVMLSSEPVYDKDVAIWHQRFPAADLFINHLGSTEVGTYRRFTIDRATTISRGILPLGYPVEDKEVLLWNEEGEEVRPGDIGEIVVKSRYLALGYWKRPDLNASLFSAPQGPIEDRLFRTGDMGFMDSDGCLHSSGRKDDQVKIRGRRVQIAGVEAALSALDHVDQAAVVARHGQDGQTLLAAFFVSAVDSLSADSLRQQLARLLPTVEVPAFFERLPALPRLPNGKIDRTVLAKREIAAKATAYIKPRDPVERRLTTILQGVLQLERLGANDNIFGYGADSLTAVEIMAAIETEFGLNLAEQALWSGGHTVAALARLIRAADNCDRSDLGPTPDYAVMVGRPTGYVEPRRFISHSDIIKLIVLPVVLLIAQLVPEGHWRRISDLVGRLYTLSRPRQCQALSEELTRQGDSLHGPADGRAVLRGIRSADFESLLRRLISPARWRIPLVLHGQEHIENGLSRGHGVILWLSPDKFAGIVGHQAVHRAGYRVHMLSRPEHGLSPTLFGQRFLNRFAYLGDDPTHAKRIVMIHEGQAEIETLRRLLRDNSVIAIAAGAQTEQPFRLRFLEGEIELATGPPRLALATGAVLLPLFAHRDAEGFRVVVCPALEPNEGKKGAAVESLLLQFVRRLESFVRQHPKESSYWIALR